MRDIQVKNEINANNKTTAANLAMNLRGAAIVLKYFGRIRAKLLSKKEDRFIRVRTDYMHRMTLDTQTIAFSFTYGT